MYSTQVSGHVSASRPAVYRALLDADAIAKWRVPAGMSSHVHEFDAREGGSFRVSLTYDSPDSAGKSAPQTDTYHGRFVKLVPNEQVVEVFEFETADPALRGTMTMTTTLADAAGGTDVLIVHEGIPDGVPAADNETGTRMALANLAQLVEVVGDEPDDIDYDELYRDTADSGGHWDIGGPQPALAEVLDDGVKGPKVLDVGCGAGDLAIALARRGYEVTAVDISRVAIDMARAKAADEGLTVRFEVQDATDLSLPSAPFDSVFDSGLLHSLRRRGGGEVDEYLALLPGLAAPGATVFVLAVSLEDGQGWGVTEEFLRAAFCEPEWVDTEVEKIDVAAETGGQELILPGFLLRTVRAFDT
jgi:uncharacterized protein YndB with AHSA1/START domain